MAEVETTRMRKPEDAPPTTGWRDLPADPHDAVTLENDVLGARLWGPAMQPTLSLGKSDIWDRRWFGSQQPPVTLARIRECAATGRLAEIARTTNDTIYSPAYRCEFPCPKPGAQFIIGAPFATRSRIAPAAANGWWLRAETPGKRLDLHLWIPLSCVLVVLEFFADGLQPDDLWLRLYRHCDTVLPGEPVNPTLGSEPAPGDFEPLPPPRCLDRRGMWGIRQDFPADPTFPHGFEVAALAGATIPDPAIENREDEVGLGTRLWAPEEGRLAHGTIKRYAPINQAAGAAATARFSSLPASFAVLATLQTTQDGSRPEEAAGQLIDEALAAGAKQLRQEDEQVMQRAQRPNPARARIGADQALAVPELIAPRLRQPGGYYGDVPLCSVGSTKLWFQDTALWHNDFHLNEIRAEPLLALGRFEEVWVYADMIRTLLPQARENAREVYGLPGAMYPLVHFPLRCSGVAHVNITWEQDLGLNGLVAKPLWLYYRYTGDRAFLEELAYPVLGDGARFCAAYLQEGDDGRLHIEPTVSPEHWGLTPGFERNRNCTSALTLTRYLLKAAAEAARTLDRDIDEASAWEEKAGRLAPYPTCATPAGPVWVDVAGAPPIEYNIPVPLSPVFWGDDVGLDSDSQMLGLARRTLEQIQVWEPHRPYLNSCVRPRLGLHIPGAPIGPENLLLSYQSIRLFPAVPDEEITMENFAAEGGFRVSAQRTGGEISPVRLHSVLGNTCRLANPWPGRTIEARREQDSARIAEAAPADPHLVFPTAAGSTYEVRLLS